MVTGFALLFAPSAFYASDQGKAYLKKIGTKNVVAARTVLLVLLLIGCGVIALFAMGALHMAGLIEQPVGR